MKAKSKILALLLSLVMVFSLMVPAFAADDKAEGETDAPVATESAEPTEGEYPAESAEPSADPEASKAPVEAQKIVILHTNDVHGGIAGYAKVAALKAKYEAEGAFVLLVDAGDFSQGDPVVSVSEGATAVELMDLAGYDVATLGNHEFD